MSAEDSGTSRGAQRRLEILTDPECLALLGRALIGRIGFVQHSAATIRPVNFVVDDGCVVFRAVPQATFVPGLLSGPVCFEADRFDEQSLTGWSVIVTGRAAVIRDAERAARVDGMLRSWMDDSAGCLVSIGIEQIAGRRVGRLGPDDD
jgi:uncharacterized protein